MSYSKQELMERSRKAYDDICVKLSIISKMTSDTEFTLTPGDFIKLPDTDPTQELKLLQLLECLIKLRREAIDLNRRFVRYNEQLDLIRQQERAKASSEAQYRSTHDHPRNPFDQ